jgi:hypothetical protein
MADEGGRAATNIGWGLVRFPGFNMGEYPQADCNPSPRIYPFGPGHIFCLRANQPEKRNGTKRASQDGDSPHDPRACIAWDKRGVALHAVGRRSFLYVRGERREFLEQRQRKRPVSFPIQVRGRTRGPLPLPALTVPICSAAAAGGADGSSQRIEERYRYMMCSSLGGCNKQAGPADWDRAHTRLFLQSPPFYGSRMCRSRGGTRGGWRRKQIPIVPCGLTRSGKDRQTLLAPAKYWL